MSLFSFSGIRLWEAAVLTSMVIHKHTSGSPLAMLPDFVFAQVTKYGWPLSQH